MTTKILLNFSLYDKIALYLFMKGFVIMFNFEYYAPTKVIFGKGTENKVSELISEFSGTRVLIHYGSESAVKSGLIDKIKSLLDENGLFHTELGGVVPNPRISKVYAGIEIAKENKIDFILAVGGGSVIDSSKAIAYALAEPEFDVWDLYEHTRKAKSALPIGCVLTISAAGSEMSASSVITNDKTNQKRSYNSNLSRPKFAIMNPEFTVTLPDYQTEAGCADIMMHTMERYFTQGGNMEITDSIAEGLLRTVINNALILHEDPKNYNARSEVMWASSLAHNNLTGCGNDGGDFSSHKLEHELGGMFDVTHGAGLTAVWPSWAKYVYKHNIERFYKYAVNVMGVNPSNKTKEETALEGIEETEKFYRKIGMPTSLEELGISVSDSQIEEMATSALKAAGGPFGSTMKLEKQDIINIYKLSR